MRKEREPSTAASSHKRPMGLASQPDISRVRADQLCSEYKSGLNVTREERERIKIATRSQSSEELWFQERKCRITASNIGVIARRRSTTPVATDNLIVNAKP